MKLSSPLPLLLVAVCAAAMPTHHDVEASGMASEDPQEDSYAPEDPQEDSYAAEEAAEGMPPQSSSEYGDSTGDAVFASKFNSDGKGGFSSSFSSTASGSVSGVGVSVSVAQAGAVISNNETVIVNGADAASVQQAGGFSLIEDH